MFRDRVALLLILFTILIGQAQASYLQVQNGTTLQANNASETIGVSDNYAWRTLKILTIPANVSGYVNLSFSGKKFGADVCNERIQINGVQVLNPIISSSYENFFVVLNRYLNTTDTVILQDWTGASTSCFVKDFNLTYNYSSISILSPPNNSAQTSRIINITWNGTAPFQYQVSQKSDFSTLFFNTTTNNNASGNLTLPVGLSYIRVRGYNATENSLTNWSTIHIVSIVDNLMLLGGSSWVWKTDQNISWNNIFGYDKGDNFLSINLLDGSKNSSTDNFNDGTHDWIGNNQSDIQIVNAQLRLTNTTTAYHVIMNDVNLSSYDVIVALKRIGTTFNRFGIATGIQNREYGNVSFRNYLIYYNNNNSYILYYINNVLNGNYNATLNDVPIVGNWYWFRYQSYGTNGYTRGKMWVYGSPEPDWENTNTNTNLSYGGVGIMSQEHSDSLVADNFWTRYVNSDGNVISSGNLTYIINSDTNKLKTIQVSLSGNISLYVNSSNDGVTWSGDVLVASNMVSMEQYNIPIGSFYNRLNFSMDIGDGVFSDTASKLKNFTVGSVTAISLSGYTRFQNGSIAPNARIIYNLGNTSSNESGYYSFQDINTSSLFGTNITFAAGLAGYKSVDTYFKNMNNSNSFNFTLKTNTKPVVSVFGTKGEQIALTYIDTMDVNGSLSTFFVGANTDVNANYAQVLSSIFSQSINVTPELYEKALRSMNLLEYCLQGNIGYTTKGGICSSDVDFNLYFFVESLFQLQDDLSNSSWNRYNQTIIEYNITANNITFGSNRESYLTSNHDLVVMRSLYGIKVLTGRTDLNSRIDNISYQIINQTTDSGYVENTVEKGVQTTYNVFFSLLGYDMIRYGYKNNTFNNTILKQLNWTHNVELVSGDIPVAGRSAGLLVGDGAYIQANLIATKLFPDVFSSGDIYRRIDKHYQNIEQYKDNFGNYLGMKNYFRPHIGLNNYNTDDKLIIRLAWSYLETNIMYESNIFETDTIYTNFFDDIKRSGIGIVSNNHYSVSTIADYQADYVGSGGVGIYPLRFVVTCKDCLNYTIYPNPFVNTTTSFDDYLNFFFLNDSSGRWKFNAQSYNRSNTTYSFTNSSMWVNTTSLSFTKTANGSVSSPSAEPLKYINFYNISAVLNTDTVHLRYELGFNSSNFNISSMLHGIDLLVDDNRTKATITTNGSDLLFVRGKESLNVTNITVTNGVFQAIIPNDASYSGAGAFGYNNRTNWNLNVSSSPIIFEYDVEINTKNVYGYVLNQPPGIWSFSPIPPVTNVVNNPRVFGVEFTQNNVNVSWRINGTEVQQNNSVSGGSTSYYTNTSAVLGNWVVNATGCNAQGCATQIWNWTVSSSISEYSKVEFLWWD